MRKVRCIISLSLLMKGVKCWDALPRLEEIVQSSAPNLKAVSLTLEVEQMTFVFTLFDSLLE
jgi:hypothetical protein